MKTLLLLMVTAAQLAAQGLPRGTPAALGFDAARLHRIDSVMQSFVDSGRIVGAVTLVVRHGRVAQLGAYGMADREAGRRMSVDALFRIASQSKAITSAAIMMLVEEGKLTLGDPVSKWIPSFAHTTVAQRSDTGLVRVPAQRAITIRDLLTHTAGISYGTDSLVAPLYAAQGLGPRAGFGWYFADKTEPVCTTIDRLGSLPFVAQPGTRFVYGYNTDILGCVVERVSGEPLDRFFAERIFGPLGMRSTFFYVPPADSARLTAVYWPRGDSVARADTGSRGQGHYLAGPRVSFSGGAGLVSTAGDYARFLEMLRNGGVLDGHRVLSPASVALMTSDQIGPVYAQAGLGFGLGFEILEDPGRAGQYGSRGAFRWGGAYGSNYWVDPAQDLVVTFMIQQPWASVDFSTTFRDLVYQAIVPNAPAGRSR